MEANPESSRDDQKTTSRFAVISENDEMLSPEQVLYIKGHLDLVRSEILAFQDPRIDEMLPEYSMSIFSIMAEFNENPKLAMIHGLGISHAWIDVNKLKEVLSSSEKRVNNYKSLFCAIVSHGYDVRKIKYIRFRSSINITDNEFEQ
jgi:hypothetical protein